MIWFAFIQEVTDEKLTVEEYYKKIEDVTKEDVIKEAKNGTLTAVDAGEDIINKNTFSPKICLRYNKQF